MRKLSNTEAELKKALLIKRKRVFPLQVDPKENWRAKVYFRRRAVLRRARTFSYNTAQIDV